VECACCNGLSCSLLEDGGDDEGDRDPFIGGAAPDTQVRLVKSSKLIMLAIQPKQ